MTPFTDNSISLEARGALAYAVAAGLETITAQAIQDTGCGRERAYRILSELAGAGYIVRVKTGYRVTAFPELSILSPGESSQELRLFRKPENPSITTTYMYESKDLMHEVKSYGFSENPTLLEGEIVQTPLTGCPEPPPPISAPPPAPTRQRNPPPPVEVKALYAPMFDLTKTVRSGKAAMGVYQKCAALWREFGATPEQVAAFWGWFKVFSPAADAAARNRRALNPPLPRQVHELWPQFLPWWEAKQAQAARDAERRRADEAARQAVAVEADETPRLSGRELYRRTFGLPRPATPMTAD